MADKGFLTKLTSLLHRGTRCEEVRLRGPYPLGSARVRVPFEGDPILVTLAKAGIEFIICPETLLDDSADPAPGSYLLLEPERIRSRISGFMRLKGRGDSLVLGKQDRQQTAMFDYPATMDLRRLSITHDGDALIFRKLVSDAEVRLAPLSGEDVLERVAVRRRERLQIIRAIFGGPIEPLDPTEALATLKAVNEILETEAFRPLDDRGRPGGVVRLPKGLTPIIVGDLHARVNNLLALLSHNGFLDMLEKGKAALIILGDAVHSEVEDKLDEMEGSLLMMDLILRLKIRFPRQLFYVRGNHDSFSEDLTKFGVAQCLIWEAALRRHRGETYLEEMKRFYDSLPYVVLSEDFVACHAAPIKTRFDLDMLVNIHRHPGLVRELTRNRLRRRTSPAGYTSSDVRHFRSTLNLPEDTPFFVSHSPLNREDPLWLEAGGIPHHHIVFSANTPWIGVFTRLYGRMIPLSYCSEELLPIINGLP